MKIENVISQATQSVFGSFSKLHLLNLACSMENRIQLMLSFSNSNHIANGQN